VQNIFAPDFDFQLPQNEIIMLNIKKDRTYSPIKLAGQLLALCLLFISIETTAQSFSEGGPRNIPTGRLYGKVVDENGSGIGYATVQLLKSYNGPAESKPKEELIDGQITEDNGDFTLEDVPVFGEMILKISFIGYGEVIQEVSFGKGPSEGGPENPGTSRPSGAPAQGGFPGAIGGGSEKDLGNIVLVPSAQELETVTVTAEKASVMLALDRKVYRVDKDASAVGGNALDALSNVPSLSVDLDGNVSLRNGSPQIFVDGRPTTLSLDQIAADAIESVEVITNPSAKYDAGGGTAGIVNIVMKKERRLGSNGNVRLGTDSQAGYNAGGDLNVRSEKTNFFISGHLNRRQGTSTGETYQQNLTGVPQTVFTQSSNNEMEGRFGNIRAGIDWFMDNRNTLTLSGNYTRGAFQPFDFISTKIDSLFPGETYTSELFRTATQDRNFRNIGSALQFKHLFPKEGMEWTADLNYNQVRFLGGSDYNTTDAFGLESLEKQENLGKARFVTFQSDFVNPFNDRLKLEGGIRASIRRNTNENNNFIKDESGVLQPVTSFADHYKFTDDVYAAYTTISHQTGNWGFQAGLRAESSFYTGTLMEDNSSFELNYPLSLFPSAFVTKNLNETDNIQLAMTRRINRPHFFQTMPFTDLSNSLNPRRGNPELRPEFLNSVELSYQNIFAKNHNLLVSVYYKQATDLITSYFVEEYVEELGEEVVVTTFANSNSSHAYGVEWTLKNTFFNRFDLTTNVNIYQSKLDAGNVENNLVVDRVSWFLKENLSVKLPASFTVQLTGEYRSKASYTPGNGGMRFGPPSFNTAQGFTLSNWFVNAAVRKDILDRNASITLSINDIFKSQRFGTHTSSSLFIQDSWRVRNPHVVRLSFSYRFGKADASLFKRKNMKQNAQGNDMM
jgi:outer membrane receptor for ferrienterochelin and colicin